MNIIFKLIFTSAVNTATNMKHPHTSPFERQLASIVVVICNAK